MIAKIVRGRLVSVKTEEEMAKENNEKDNDLFIDALRIKIQSHEAEISELTVKITDLELEIKVARDKINELSP